MIYTANKNKAFTLLELVISMAIATTILSSLYWWFASSTRQSRITEESLNSINLLESMATLLRQDLKQVRPFQQSKGISVDLWNSPKGYRPKASEYRHVLFQDHARKWKKIVHRLPHPKVREPKNLKGTIQVYSTVLNSRLGIGKAPGSDKVDAMEKALVSLRRRNKGIEGCDVDETWIYIGSGKILWRWHRGRGIVDRIVYDAKGIETEKLRFGNLLEGTLVKQFELGSLLQFKESSSLGTIQRECLRFLLHVRLSIQGSRTKDLPYELDFVVADPILNGNFNIDSEILREK